MQALRRDDRPRAHAGRDARSRTCSATRSWSTRAATRFDVARASTRTRRRRSATPRARPAIRRACSTATARRCCTPIAIALPDALGLLGARRRSCRSCRCSTSTPGACRTPRRMVGAKLVFPGPRLDGKSAATSCSRASGVTLSAGVPTVWLGLLELHARPTTSSSRRMQRTVIGGSAVPAGDDARPSRSATASQVLHAWGMTEMSPLGTVVHAQGQARRARRAERGSRSQAKQGRAVFGVDMKIVDDDGQRAAARRQGVRRADGARARGSSRELLQGRRRRPARRRRRLVPDRRRRDHRRRRLHADHRPLART